MSELLRGIRRIDEKQKNRVYRAALYWFASTMLVVGDAAESLGYKGMCCMEVFNEV